MAQPLQLVQSTKPSLRSIAHEQSNALHDITALLGALQASLEAIDTEDDIDHLFRLAQMSKDKIAGIVAALDPYI